MNVYFHFVLLDIDTIEIRSDEDAETSSITTRRNYNYKASQHEYFIWEHVTKGCFPVIRFLHVRARTWKFELF